MRYSLAAGAQTIWVEGEKPARSTMNRHPWWYDQVKKDQLSGGDWVSNFYARVTDVEEKAIDEAWKLVAAMKKEGAYVTRSVLRGVP
jgi:hypothetical protein